MIYIVIIIFIILIVCAIAYFILNGWVQTHAFAVLTGPHQWEILETGWSSLWVPLAVGALAGLVLFLIISALVSESLHTLITSRLEDALQSEKQALVDLREQLAHREASIDTQIKKITNIKIKETESVIEILQKENIELKNKLHQAAFKNDKMLGRMKGAQQKASRIKKKAQLTSV